MQETRQSSCIHLWKLQPSKNNFERVTQIKKQMTIWTVIQQNDYQKATAIYSEASKKSAFKESLVFIPKTNTSDNTSKKQRKRKIIWFNHLFSVNVKTKIGRTFLKLLKQHIPKPYRLHKIFNKNKVKVSYSCMSNMSSIILSHNKRLSWPRNIEHGCNCRTSENCPLQNQCLAPGLTYQADVENNPNIGTKLYFGFTETSSKLRFTNHNKDFNHKQ